MPIISKRSQGAKPRSRTRSGLPICSSMGAFVPVSFPGLPNGNCGTSPSFRTRLVEQRARQINRLQKTDDATNLKLGDVVSDIMGKAARMILSALANGE